MRDKQDECGCHKECETTPHLCDKPCIWPKCLNEKESQELLDELNQDAGRGNPFD